MRFMLKNGKKRELIALSCIYLFSHFFLIIASGRWWDDWCFYNKTTRATKQMALMLGRPEIFFIYKFAKAMPEPGYRIITFLMFYFCMLFLYKILRMWLHISHSACFWICAIYAVIPANDARIMLCIFPYTIGLFFFMAGMSYLSGVLQEEDFHWGKRVFAQVLFLFSFILNSNLFFYGIVLLMILMKEKSVKRLIRYADFVLLPIVFFVVKSILFPAYGEYENYNSVTLWGLVTAVKYILPADVFALLKLSINLLPAVVYEKIKALLIFSWSINVACIVTIFLIINLKKVKEIFHVMAKHGEMKFGENKLLSETIRENVLVFIMGGIALSAGLFPYVAVRQFYQIETEGTGGRDAVLVAFGAAMILYALISLFMRPRFAAYVYSVVIACGCLYFNTYYLSFQQDYYRQLGFQYQLAQHGELEEANNIVYLNSDAGLINIQSIYVLNGNAEVVYGNQKKFVMGGFRDALLLKNEDGMLDYCVESEYYHMSDYDRRHKRIDAIVEYSLDVDLFDTAKMKLYEIINSDKFETEIADRSSMQVYLDGTEEYDNILVNVGYENIE